MSHFWGGGGGNITYFNATNPKETEIITAVGGIGGGMRYTVSATTYDSIIGGFVATIDTPHWGAVGIVYPDSWFATEMPTIDVTGTTVYRLFNDLVETVVIITGGIERDTKATSATGAWSFNNIALPSDSNQNIVIRHIDRQTGVVLSHDTRNIFKITVGFGDIIFSDTFDYSANTDNAPDSSWRAKSTDGATNNDVFGKAWQFDNTDGGSNNDGYCTWTTAMLDVRAYARVKISVKMWSDPVNAFEGDERFYMVVDTGYGFITFMDSTGMLGANVQESTFLTRVQDTLILAISALTQAGGERYYFDSVSITATDTVGFSLAVSGGQHDTNVSPTALTGLTSLVAGDSVQIYINNSRRDSAILTANGVWSVANVVLADGGGESVAVYAYAGGVYVRADTITIRYDGTPPKLTKRGGPTTDTNTIYDGSKAPAADVYVLFSVRDTGVGLTAGAAGTSPSCTLAWHIDRMPGFDTVRASVKDAGSGTYVIEALLPLSIYTTDTTIGFWWVCHDNMANGTAAMASSLSGPAYTANSPGTFTVSRVGVRDVVISEIMWNGSGGEYVELFNMRNTDINLNGWTMSDGHGSSGTGFGYSFTSKDIIPARGYFVVMQGYSQNRFVYMDLFDTGVTGVDTAEVSSWTSGELAENADSITITDGTVEIDSAGFLSSGWPAGGVSGYTGASSRWAVSMERKFTGLNFDTVGYGSSSTEWDSNRMNVGHHGRPHGTPGHANSINIPFISDISPKNPVMENGRGKWTITVTNGPIGFANGRAAVQVPPGWSAPGNTTTSAGYTTVSVSAGSINATSFSGQTVLVDLTSWPAAETMTITYGDYTSSGDRRSAARAEATSRGDTAQFFLFYDFDGTSLVQVGDSELITYGSGLDTGRLVGGLRRGDTIMVVDWGGATMDTTPSSNPNSFINSEYELIMTVSDSKARKVYGAHDSVSIRPLIGTTAAGDSHIHEFADFTGLYDYGVNDSTEVGGWTNTNGQFTVTVHVSGISGNVAQLNQFRVTDADKRVLGTTLTYSDSARLPVPVINEVMWAGGAAATDWLELYNPTHAEQSLAGYQIFDGKGGLTDSTANIMVNATVLSGRTLPPFSYLLIGGTGKSPGDSVDVGTTANMSTTETALIMFKNTGLVDQHLNLSGSGNWFGGTNGTSTRDYSMERIFSNRSGTLSTSWGTSDSTVGTDSRGSPRRPNDRALANTTSKFFDVLDTLSGKVSGQTDATLDSNRINFTLRIASGDTQPNQHIGFEARVHRGPFNYGSISDSSFLVTTSPPDSTNHLGTAVLHVSANSNNFSGTVAIKCRTPYGVPDTAYIVFDRGDSLGYIFQSSETNIFDTSAQNAMVVFVNIKDTFSGVDSSIMPQLRWKIGTGGTYSSMQDMKWFTADTYLARIDISSSTWAIKPHDTIYWQVTWRDKAGNYDTSVNNSVAASEYIDNTRARDTIVRPVFSDTMTGTGDTITIKLVDQANDFCTITVKYDQSGSGVWTSATLVSLFDTTNNLMATTAGQSHSVVWNTIADFGSSATVASVRLRIEVFDGFDTHTDTSGYFGVSNSSNVAPRDTIILPTSGDTFASGETYSAAVGIKFVILDPDSNFCTVVVQFSKDSGQAWATATLSGTSVITNLYAPTFGDTKTIAWLSKSDIPDTLTGIARIRITPSDGTDTGLPDTTLNFGIDNQRPPIVPQCTAAAVVAVADSGVYIFWAHAQLDSDVRGYYVYRSSTEDSVSSTRLSGLLTDTRGYKDMSIVQGDTRYYYVTSVDTYDNEGDSSQIEAAPNLDIAKTVSDSSNPIAIRPGDTITFRITIRNTGFAPADSIAVFDYVPANTVFYDSPTAMSVLSSWSVHYRVAGGSGVEVWQSPFTETATMVRFTRAKRMDPSTATASDTLTIRVKIQ